MRLFRPLTILLVFLVAAESPATKIRDPDDHGKKGASEKREKEPSTPPTTGSVDMDTRTSRGVGLCQGTPVYNRPLKNQSKECLVALYTAAHCLMFYYDAKDDLERQILIRHAGKELNFHSDRIDIKFRSEDFEQFRRPGLQAIDRLPREDSALLVLRAPCASVDFLKEIKLASRDDRPGVLYFQKRGKAASDGTNPGGSSVLQTSFLSENEFGHVFYHVATPQGQTMNTGDSGGAVMRIENGERLLYGAMCLTSTLNASQTPQPFEASFDAGGVGWASKQLASFVDSK